MSVLPAESLQRGRDVGVVMLNPSKLVWCERCGAAGTPALGGSC